jgi:hypothetical protein
MHPVSRLRAVNIAKKAIFFMNLVTFAERFGGSDW